MLIAVSSFGESPRRDLLTALAGAVFNSIQNCDTCHIHRVKYPKGE